MKNTVTRRIASTQSIAFGAAWLTVLIAPPAFAQQNIERVEITGSSIRRVDAETALPVQIVTRQEIEATGSANVEQFLQGLGVALQGNTNSVAATASGATTGGVSSASLRGLGSQRTLVLIDGKRVSAGGTLTDSTTVDVNHIPVAAIERVEVLKDGASAIYGSDAIAGVINFILRKDYKGGEATANTALVQYPGGGQGWGTNALLGWGGMANDGFNATVSFDYRKQEALYGAQRPFASSGIDFGHLNDTSSGNTFPANFVAADGSFGTRNLFFPTCPGPYSTFSPLFANLLGSRGCRFDPSPLVSLLPESEQKSLFGTLRYAFASNLEGYGQFSYSNKEQRTIIQPVPISDQFALPPNHPLFNTPPYSTFGGVSAFLLTPSSPYYPTAFVQAQTGGPTPDLLVRYRSAITGNRDITDISEQTRLVLGLKSVIFRGWDSDVAYLHIDTKLTERVNNGYPSLSAILPLLNGTVPGQPTLQVNPFGASTPAVQAAADAAQFRGDAWKTKTSIDGVSATVRHDLTQLPGGPLALAVGTDGRREGFVLDPSPAIQSGDISGYGGNFFPIDRSRLVGAGYAELAAPVVRGVEVTGALRYDHYENVGSKTSPKVGATYKPVREVLLRGSVGKGFRAPALTELYQPQVVGVSTPGLSDPARCPTTGSSNDCVTQFPITIGGNTALKPEISTNSTLGIVFEPINNASFAFDWWQVNLKETIISGISPAVILADQVKYGSYITRAAPDPSCPGCPGQITNIAQTNTNLGETRVQGLDLDFRYRMPAIAPGVYTVGLNGTYFLKYDLQNVDGSFSSINGQVSPIVNGNGGVIPRWRHYLYVDWKLAPWSLTLAQQYQSRYQDIPGTFEDPTDPAFMPRNVSAYSLFHFSSSYSGVIDKNLKLTFVVRNLLNTKPPYTNAGGQNYFQAGYDPGYVDPRGRTFLLGATYKFM